MTVDGPIAPDNLGITLIHEHLFMDASPVLGEHGYDTESQGVFDCCLAGEARWNPGVHLDNYKLTDVDMVVEELSEYKSCGGVSVVECTPVDIGRNPLAVQNISNRSGVLVVLGCGYYLEASHRPFVTDRSVEEIAEEMITEFTDGIGETGIRPGIIGEIGTNDPITSSEKKILKAAALAWRKTGLAITVHIHPWGWEGQKALSILLEEGVPPNRIILNHMNTAVSRDDYQLALLNAGVYLAYDLFGFDHSALGLGRYIPSDHDVAQKVAELINKGYRDQIMISQDVAVRTRLRRYGGWGYSHILRHIVPLLKDLGVVADDITALLVDNPRKVLTIQGPE